MKVLSNLMGNDTKISANCIAIKDNSNNAKTLDNYLKGMDVYSTSEIKTNKVWIDGKPMYRKVIAFTTTVATNTLFTLAHGISNMSFYHIAEAFINSGSGLSCPMPMVGYTNSLTDKIFCYMDANSIYFYANGSWGQNWTKYVVIEYTKTTD